MSLNEAIKARDLQAVEALLEGGASPSALEGGCTALHLAVQVGDAAILDALLKTAGVDVNARDAGLRTPLHQAAKRRQGSLPFLQRLLAAGADPSVHDQSSDTPLHVLCDARIDRSCASGAAVRLLLKAGQTLWPPTPKATPLCTLLIPTYAPAAPGTQETLLGPAAAALWAAGDRTCWRLTPRGCRGLEQGLTAMMKHQKGDVPLLVARMHPEARRWARCILWLFNREKLSPEVAEIILDMALCP